MKTPKASVALPDSRQLKLLFETGQLSGLSAAERSKEVCRRLGDEVDQAAW